MNTGDVVALISILVIVGLATLYIIVSKKKGKKCIGCPYASSCAVKGGSCCNCSETKNGIQAP